MYFVEKIEFFIFNSIFHDSSENYLPYQTAVSRLKQKSRVLPKNGQNQIFRFFRDEQFYLLTFFWPENGFFAFV